MDPWDFGWDAIAALAGVAAVIIASVLGFWGISIATRSVERSAQDYVGQRADITADISRQLKLLTKELDGEFTKFWSIRSGDTTGDEPDWMPAQQKFYELEALASSFLTSVKGLQMSFRKDKSHPNESSAP